ncbi:MAG: acyl-CoA thioesterase [Rhizobiaceae bacterium]|nr:acyl-CoA thioesterase [Rhizobiaceae bacterium]
MDTTPAPDRHPLSARADYALFRKIGTRWSDNDLYGHMNNVVHYQLFDTAVNGWLIEERWLDAHRGETIGLVVETGCRYHAEAAFPDRIMAGIRVGRLGSSSVRYEVGLFRNEETLAFAEGFFVHVYVNRATRRPEPLPSPFRARLQEISP